jgi:hypothetical protein
VSKILKTCNNVTKTSNFLHSTNSKREVAAIKTTPKKKGFKPGKGTKNGPNFSSHYGHYPSEEYCKLNPKQRSKLRAKCEADGKGGGKRKAVWVAVADLEDGEVEKTLPKKMKTTKTVTIKVGTLKTTDKKAQLKMTGETKADKDDPVIPFNSDKCLKNMVSGTTTPTTKVMMVTLALRPLNSTTISTSLRRTKIRCGLLVSVTRRLTKTN